VPSRMVSVSASVNLPLHHKVQKFSSGTGSPRWSRKKCRTTVVVWCKWSLVTDTERGFSFCLTVFGRELFSTIRQPGFYLPRHYWSLINWFWTNPRPLCILPQTAGPCNNRQVSRCQATDNAAHTPSIIKATALILLVTQTSSELVLRSFHLVVAPVSCFVYRQAQPMLLKVGKYLPKILLSRKLTEF